VAEPVDRITEIRQRRIPLGPDAIWTLTRDRDALLAEVDRLTAELTTAEGQRDDHRKALKRMGAEVARLQDALVGDGLAIADLERERGALAVRAADLQCVADAARAVVDAVQFDTSPEMSALRGLLATTRKEGS
jgi:predicted  nucleic acid-binding Zn-ribbon protein